MKPIEKEIEIQLMRKDIFKMAKLNLDYYQNENGYSDGPIEQELLKRIKSGENIENIIDKDDRWPILYHLSHLRENILNWYPFSSSAHLLEIGAGCGAITGMLCDKVAEVTSVELTKDRSLVIYERYKKRENLEIIVGNFHQIEFNKKFDYIILNGVFEYAASFTNTDAPYTDFLSQIKNLLKPEGKILIAIENRLGLKYLNGAKEDHTSQLFSGLDNYRFIEGVKTFSQKEWIDLIKEVGFSTYEFYYPVYDYKFANMIFTEDSFNVMDYNFFIHAFDNERFTFFDENEMMRSLINEGVFGKFSNSFLIEIGLREKKSKEEKVIFSKISNQRKSEFRIITKIIEKDQKKYVIKEGLNEKSILHLKRMLDHKINESKYFDNAKIEQMPKGVSMEFVQGDTFEKKIIKLLEKNKKSEFEDAIRNFADKIREGSIFTDQYRSRAFKMVFGEEDLGEKVYCKKNLNIDMLFSNIFLNDDIYKVIDFEWCFDFNIPVEFLIWRSLNMLYYCNPTINKNYSYKQIFEVIGVKIERFIKTFESWNKFFGDNYVGMEQFNHYEKEKFLLTNYSDSILNQYKIESRLYFDTGDGFNIDQALHNFKNISNNKLNLKYDLTKMEESICKLRWDPCENCCRIKNITLKSNELDINIYPINSVYKSNNWSYFLTNDPIYFIEGSLEKITNMEISCEIKKLTKKEIEVINRILQIQKEKEIETQEEEIETRIEAYNDLKNSYEIIVNSTIWKKSEPLRIMMDVSKEKLKNNKHTKLFYKTIINTKEKGIVKTIKKIKEFTLRQKEIKKFETKTGINLQDEKNLRYSAYESEYQYNKDFSNEYTEVKAITFYLPQFHRIKENDEWWGNGFTEWTNTAKTDSRFQGHYQPRVPHEDIGYYNLDDINVLKKQIELAKQHGIYGFCFYYYWFSGRRIMEKPVDMLLEHQEIDFPFCLCWANENFTRAWDGQDKEVLLGQMYTAEDRYKFIDDLQRYIEDKRYIRIENKPLIIVYNPGEIPEIKETFFAWRMRAKKIGIGEILIWTCQTANNTATKLKIENIIDGELEFPPHNMWYDVIGIRDIDLGGKEACIYDYRKLVDILEKKCSEKESSEKVPIYRTAMLGWDNAARRENNWTTFYGFSLKSFYKWVSLIIEEAREKFDESKRFIFVNAWNEWAEGTYLEPDEKYGYANINTFSKALLGIPFDEFKIFNKNSYQPIDVCLVNKFIESPRIAIQVHLYYLDTIDEIFREINKIPYKFDCYITTNTIKKKSIIEEKIIKYCHSDKFEVDVVENRGRDVAPFLIQMGNKISKYEYICHIHSKKTATNNYGEGWRSYLYHHLFGSRENIEQILNSFENNKRLGIIFPETYPLVEPQAHWGDNELDCKVLLQKMGLNDELNKELVFPVGNMFWARTSAIKRIFEMNLQIRDFPIEKGQTNLTLGHQIERLWGVVCVKDGYEILKTYNDFTNTQEYSSLRRIALYVHYDKKDIICQEDLDYLKSLNEFVEEIIFITNSDISNFEKNKVSSFVSKIIQRENVGYDFGAWKDVILSLGFPYLEKFDQLLLVNNSCYCRSYDFKDIFKKMESECVDFWGITLFPYLDDGEYIHKSCIDEHIQSYFQVFGKEVIKSEAFHEFWKSVKNYTNLIEVIANCETILTKKLSDAGFKYDVFIKETRIMSEILGNFSIPYEVPSALITLGSPFIKKKSKKYMSLSEKIKMKKIIKE